VHVVARENAIPLGETRAFEFGTVPQRDTTVTLEIVARMDYPSTSGSSMFMRLTLNGQEIRAAKSRTVQRLLNKPAVSPVATDLPAIWCDGDHWRLVYAPDFEGAKRQPYYVGDPYRYLLDVTDLTNPAAENRIEITNTAPKHSRVFRNSGGELVIDRLVIQTKPGASPTMASGAGIAPVINRGEPGPEPRDAHYTGRLWEGGGFSIAIGDETWELSTGISFPNAGLNWLVPRKQPDASGQRGWEVRPDHIRRGGEVWAEGPDYRVRRKVQFSLPKVSICDEIVNLHPDRPLGLLVRHDLSLAGKTTPQVRLAGNPDPAINNYYSPANPSVHVVVGEIGIGMICEDTVFRNQARLYCEQSPLRAGIRTEMLYLPPGGARELEWSVYVVASRDYYDFINLVREDWGANYTVEGPWAFFNPDTIIATPIEKLRGWFSRLGINYACYCGGWVDWRHDKKKIGFGTGVMDPYWADFRRRLKEATAKLRKVRPGLKVLIYYDTQRDTSDGGHERFRDSWLTTPKGNQLSTRWSGQYSLTWSVVATLENSFGKAMLDVADRYIDEIGVDGLYWDEMEATGYGAPLLTHSMHDGVSCVLDPQTYTIARKVGVSTLLGEAHRLAVIDRVREKGGTLMGNGPTCTRALLQRRVQRMVEIQHNDYWCYQGNLDTPLGYASSRTDFGNWTRALRVATLLVGTRYNYSHEISPYVFPFTPIELHHGYLLGRERIITVHYGRYGWQDDTSLVVCHRFDKDGKRHPADWPTTIVSGATRTDVRLCDEEVAVLVRVPCKLSGTEDVVIQSVMDSEDGLRFTAHGSGTMKVSAKGAAKLLELSTTPTAFSIGAD